MTEDMKDIADLLGAKIVGEVPDVGGGAFSAAFMAKLYQARMKQYRQAEQGGPPDGNVPPPVQFTLSAGTVESLDLLARLLGLADDKASPASSAAILLERMGPLLVEEIERYQFPTDFAIGLHQVAGEIMRNVLRRLMSTAGSEHPIAS